MSHTRWWPLALLAAVSALHQPEPSPAAEIRVRRLPLSFEPNVGQAPEGAGFVVHVGHAVGLLSSSGLESAGLRMSFPGAADVAGEGLDELPGRANYLIGNDPSAWKTDIRTFARVSFPNVWPGVDVVWRG